MHSPWPISALCVALVVVACGTTRAPETATPAGENVLTLEDIDRANVGSLYDLIRMRRPRWLQRTQSRPTSLIRPSAEVVVYLDGQRFGGPESLQRLTAASVGLVEFLSPSEAQARFGHDNLGGVIHVHTRGTSTGRD